MNAQEHRSAAERLLDSVRNDLDDIDPTNKVGYATKIDRAGINLAAAAVHARLASIPDTDAALATLAKSLQPQQSRPVAAPDRCREHAVGGVYCDLKAGHADAHRFPEVAVS